MQAASFVEDDAFNATMFMTDAEQKFGVAEQKVSSLVAAAVELDGAIDKQMNALMSARRLITIISAVLAVLLSIVASTLLGHLISRPILAMTGAMRQLAGGDLATDIPATDRRDEVGQMAQAMVVFKANAQEAHRLQATAGEGVCAEGATPGGDGSTHAGLRHLGCRRHGEPGAFRGGDARDSGGYVRCGASHA